MSPDTPRLPEGLLLSWYGDDFTGSSAVMEVLTTAGLPAVLFFAPPTPEQLAKFGDLRAIGIAGIARSKSPAWMEENLPPIFEALAEFGAPLLHYKVCSTFDSSPATGSIGKAIDIAVPIVDSDWIPLVVAAPDVRRYQAFGNLFASVGDTGYRLDRHPTMSRHPATPMDEADIPRHLARQTDRRIGLVDLVAMKSGHERARLSRQREEGCEIIALDVVDDETLQCCGNLIWENRTGPRFIVGSQGAEYALVAHWRAEGLIDEKPDVSSPGPVSRMAVISGSCSPDTARQIDWACEHGFSPLRVDVTRAVDPGAWSLEIERSVAAALDALGKGRDPILFTARGPDDPAVAAFNDAIATSGSDPLSINQRLGTGLGKMLDRLLRTTGLKRCVIAGGDTSGHGVQALDIHALTALVCTTPGAPLCRAHSDRPTYADLEIALKGGQMGPPDYFGIMKQGGSSA